MDSSVKFVPLLVGLLLAVIMVGAVFVPVVQSSTTQTITTEIENEGAEWLKLGYNEGEDYSFTVGFDGEDNFSVGTQTGEYKNLICYADNERTLFVSGDYWYLLTTGETPSVYKFTDNANVTNASGTLTILDGSETVYTGASPTWAYVPDANGVYGFFTEGGLNLEEGKPAVAVGSYAGVFAYNDTVVAPGNADLGLTMSGNYGDGEVIWIVAPSELDTLSALPTDTLEPAVVDLDPISLDPIDLGGSGSVGLMSADPTGSTKVGDLYYSFTASTQTAVVMGYSSSANITNLEIPSIVSYNSVDYTVTELNSNTFQNCTTLVSVVIPNTVTKIGGGSFQGCSNLVSITIPDSVTSMGNIIFKNCTSLENVIIPDSVSSLGYGIFYGCTNLVSAVLPNGLTGLGQDFFRSCSNLETVNISDGITSIGNKAFYGCSNLDTVKLPSALTTLGEDAFYSCSNFEYIIIPAEVVSIGTDAFRNCVGVENIIFLSNPALGPLAFNNTGSPAVLNLSGEYINASSMGSSTILQQNIKENVPAIGYIAPTSIHETEVIPIDSPVAGLMQMLPLIAGVGALLLAVGTMIYTRF